MAQRELELILVRQLAGYLTIPLLVVDEKGDLIFFNEPAEGILGRRFDEMGAVRRGEWSALFKPTADDGTPLKREEQLLYIATEYRRPAHRRFWIQGLDGVRRKIEGIAFPLIGQRRRLLGALGVFWKLEGS